MRPQTKFRLHNFPFKMSGQQRQKHAQQQNNVKKINKISCWTNSRRANVNREREDDGKYITSI